MNNYASSFKLISFSIFKKKTTTKIWTKKIDKSKFIKVYSLVKGYKKKKIFREREFSEKTHTHTKKRAHRCRYVVETCLRKKFQYYLRNQQVRERENEREIHKYKGEYQAHQVAIYYHHGKRRNVCCKSHDFFVLDLFFLLCILCCILLKKKSEY